MILIIMSLIIETAKLSTQFMAKSIRMKKRKKIVAKERIVLI